MLFPIAAAAGGGHSRPQATTAGAGGTVYGGGTTQQFPVVIETNKNGQKVVHARIAIRLTCTSGAIVTVPDDYGPLSVKRRRFGRAFGPDTLRNDDGTTTDFEGAISGAFNKARTKASGRWSLKATDHDASGAITDTCDSGSVSWTAKQ
jgi:hypothetical protein